MFPLVLLLLLQSGISFATTEAPVIGILAQEFNDTYDSYIDAAYVKFLESGGALVLPVWIDQEREYYERLVNYTNGILFPGIYYPLTKRYIESAKIIYEIVQEVNDRGIYYPLMGICLGMESMVLASNDGKDLRTPCYSMKKVLPLEFVEEPSETRIYKDLPANLLEVMQNQPISYNYHVLCLTEKSLKKNNLDDIWRVITTNRDLLKIKFASTIEHKKYPFYGLQFHPEKGPFEFLENMKIPHNLNMTVISQYFSNFFIEEARKNENSFPNNDQLLDSLIYNFNPTFTAKTGSLLQLYLFEKSVYNTRNK